MKINDALRPLTVRPQTPMAPTAPAPTPSSPRQTGPVDSFGPSLPPAALALAPPPAQWSPAPSLDNVRKGGGLVMGPGMEGESVRQLQRMLGLPVDQQDGKFGEGTRTAVDAFQKSAGLQVPPGLEGRVGATTLQVLEKAAANRSTPGTGATVNLDQELASPRSLISRAIGHAEGNLDVNGNTTGSYSGHTDYGNGKTNQGTFSYQHGALSPEQADQAQLAKFRDQRPAYEAAARKAGLDPNNPLLAAAYFDTFTQSEAAANLPGGFLEQLPRLAREGVTPENIVEARVRSYVDPNTGRLDAPAFGNDPAELRRDQARRMDAVVSVLRHEGKSGTTPPTTTPTHPTPATPSPSAPGTLLKNGASGPEVEALQKQLAKAGFDPGGIDGAFGPNTEAAVMAFQRASGLDMDGQVGPRTRAALDKATTPAPAPTPSTPSTGTTQWTAAPSLADVASGKGVLKQGMQGESVKELQKLLGVEADGKFGKQTADAVASFQKSAGLKPPPGMEGQVGKTTLEVLKKAGTTGAVNGTVDTHNPILQKLATGSLSNGPYGTCVTTTLDNMDALGVPNFPGGTAADPNNPRGAMVRMMREANWVSVLLPGSHPERISSPAFGDVTANVISADDYEKLAQAGKIPSGALIFQTRHGWDYSGGSSGNDMGIVRDGGRVTHNFESMNPIIYDDAKSVVILVPRDALRPSTS